MANEYGGHWVTTYLGMKFHFLDPQPDEIHIEDIAHALSLTCRFGGQCREFYSVAEHSIRVAEILPDKYKLLGLLHDASEAYLPDLPRPMKACLTKFKTMENHILRSIWRKFGVNDIIKGKPVVKEADNILLATEARDLMANTDDWAPLPPPLERSLAKPLTSREAEWLFLVRFNDYTKER